jgi:hypothetical protein
MISKNGGIGPDNYCSGRVMLFLKFGGESGWAKQFCRTTVSAGLFVP